MTHRRSPREAGRSPALTSAASRSLEPLCFALVEGAGAVTAARVVPVDPPPSSRSEGDRLNPARCWHASLAQIPADHLGGQVVGYVNRMKRICRPTRRWRISGDPRGGGRRSWRSSATRPSSMVSSWSVVPARRSEHRVASHPVARMPILGAWIRQALEPAQGQHKVVTELEPCGSDSTTTCSRQGSAQFLS